MKCFSVALAAIAVVSLGHAEEAKIEWTNDLAKVKTPDAPVSGTLLGNPFKMETVAYDSAGSIMFRQMTKGEGVLSIAIVLPAKATADLAGTSLELGPKTGMRQSRPSIHVSIRPDPNALPKGGIHQVNYSLRLEFGANKNGMIPGKIYLCLPDREKSVIAGTFNLPVK